MKNHNIIIGIALGAVIATLIIYGVIWYNKQNNATLTNQPQTPPNTNGVAPVTPPAQSSSPNTNNSLQA